MRTCPESIVLYSIFDHLLDFLKSLFESFVFSSTLNSPADFSSLIRILINMKTNFLHKKLISILLCLTLPLQAPVMAKDVVRGAVPIPSQYGTIDEVFQAPSSRHIIYIQDAHDSLEAQENIAAIIDYLVEHHGVRTVLEEGYEGPVPSDEYFGGIERVNSRSLN